MKKTRFLFINKDASSDSLSHSNKRERIRIHSHVQLGRKHSRNVRIDLQTTASFSGLNPIATSTSNPLDTTPELSPLFDGSHVDHRASISTSSTNGANPKSTSTPLQESSIPNSNSPQSIHPLLRAYSAAIPNIPQSPEHVIDPFSSTCIPVDAEVHRLLSYFLTVSHPNTWHMETRDNVTSNQPHYSYRHNAHSLVSGCLHNDVNMYTLLASMASQLRYLDKFSSQRDSGPLIYKAIVALQKHMRTAQPMDERMIFNMMNLGCAEFYRYDVPASLVHLKAVKVLIDSFGGIRNIHPSLRELVVLGDGYVAAELLTAPLFDAADFDPGDDDDMSQYGLESMQSVLVGACRFGTSLLAAHQRNIVPSELRWVVMDMAVCLAVLNEYITPPSSPDSSNTATPSRPRLLHWLHLRNLAIRHRLLAMNLVDPRTHVLRLALVMWVFLVFTVSGRKRSVKVLAPRLRALLLFIDDHSWTNHGEIRLWILIIGALGSDPEGLDYRWFLEEIVNFGEDIIVLDESGLKTFCERFFYFDAIQSPGIQALVRAVDDLKLKRLSQSALQPTAEDEDEFDLTGVEL